jgi:hypothetical protein
MSKCNPLRIAVALSIATALTLPGTAIAQQAQKKISYEEAFRRCKEFIDKEKGGLAHSNVNEVTRATRGAACMKKFGHRL